MPTPYPFPPVAGILYRHNGKGITDIVSRAYRTDVWGEECTYLGPDHDGRVWFVRPNGNAAWLDERLLYQAGYVIVDYRDCLNGGVARQFEATRERNAT